MGVLVPLYTDPEGLALLDRVAAYGSSCTVSALVSGEGTGPPRDHVLHMAAFKCLADAGRRPATHARGHPQANVVFSTGGKAIVASTASWTLALSDSGDCSFTLASASGGAPSVWRFTCPNFPIPDNNGVYPVQITSVALRPYIGTTQSGVLTMRFNGPSNMRSSPASPLFMNMFLLGYALVFPSSALVSQQGIAALRFNAAAGPPTLTLAGRTSILPEPSGSGSQWVVVTSGGVSIRVDKGWLYNPTTKIASQCPFDTYSPVQRIITSAGVDTCTSCPSGSNTRTLLGSSDCKCLAGFVGTGPTAPACTACAADTVADGGGSPFTPGTYYVKAGYFLDVTGPLALCPKGFVCADGFLVATAARPAGITACDPGKTTTAEGSSSATDCIDGTVATVESLAALVTPDAVEPVVVTQVVAASFNFEPAFQETYSARVSSATATIPGVQDPNYSTLLQLVLTFSVGSAVLGAGREIDG
ncbi:hypothetical protein HYH03_010884 [Edaphochlamys debaryana]|uniref:Tyrosine-protein kinase ephrin type A/B receptor-like domain-containing protein n=1 Tax=Edaphochlamys debaryana TaxID=47281 RepID=A0A835XV27_9CHLO|nr:hypothetical protein HYH03_010884 [Edaphochlamys debaryana]|eukprot:KAG2490728.1 hypothetical protein HYH03_010884 [Edaphochlamys debaryana]